VQQSRGPPLSAPLQGRPPQPLHRLPSCQNALKSLRGRTHGGLIRSSLSVAAGVTAAVVMSLPPQSRELLRRDDWFFRRAGASVSRNASPRVCATIRPQHKSQFVANMSHELRTPLAAVLGYAELMQEGFYEPLGQKSLDALTRIRSNGKHLLGLINAV